MMQVFYDVSRATVTVYTFVSVMPISSPNSIFDYLLKLSHKDDSNKWSIIGYGEETTRLESIKVYFTHLTWSP